MHGRVAQQGHEAERLTSPNLGRGSKRHKERFHNNLFRGKD
jgi:hypothetical protein